MMWSGWLLTKLLESIRCCCIVFKSPSAGPGKRASTTCPPCIMILTSFTEHTGMRHVLHFWWNRSVDATGRPR